MLISDNESENEDSSDSSWTPEVNGMFIVVITVVCYPDDLWYKTKLYTLIEANFKKNKKLQDGSGVPEIAHRCKLKMHNSRSSVKVKIERAYMGSY